MGSSVHWAAIALTRLSPTLSPTWARFTAGTVVSGGFWSLGMFLLDSENRSLQGLGSVTLLAGSILGGYVTLQQQRFCPGDRWSGAESVPLAQQPATEP